MFTGRQAFGGQTVTDVLAAIIEREPEWSLLPASTPTTVRRLLRRCLAKDPNKRLHDIADARLELDDAADEPILNVPTTAKSQRISGQIGWVVAIVSTVIVAAAAGWLAAHRISSAPTDGPVADAKLER